MSSVRSRLAELETRPPAARTLELLNEICARELTARELLPVHEALLFYKAYPPSPAIYALCRRELARFITRIEALPAAERAALAQTGMAGTRIDYPYDERMVAWLFARRGCRLELDWEAYAERDTDPISEYLPFFLPRALGDAVDDPNLSPRDLIQRLRGNAPGSDLGWLHARFGEAFTPPYRQQVYNSFELALSLELERGGPSRTELDDGIPPRLFLWDPASARAPFHLLTEIRRPLRLPPPAPPQRGRDLLSLCYGALLPRLRELYPAIHGNPAEVYDIPLERGIRVIFWFMKPEWRLPLEAGWACLLLKNHTPIGYGAGGLLADRAEIAINVYDTFRGGEAAWLYSQYARICYAFCRPRWLVTRKYQIGYKNEEGLASGSFWFYDKLGFRSVDAEIRKLTEEERAQIKKQRGYRSPKRILRKLSAEDVALSLEGKDVAEYREFPLAGAGLVAARVIASQFGGESHRLETRVLRVLKERLGWTTQGLTSAERSSLAQMGLFVLALPEVIRWPARDRAALFELCRAKGSAREADYARAFVKNRRFFAALEQKVREAEANPA